MSKKQDTFYYDNFIACAEEASRAADLLKKTLEDFHSDQIAGKLLCVFSADCQPQ